MPMIASGRTAEDHTYAIDWKLATEQGRKSTEEAMGTSAADPAREDGRKKKRLRGYALIVY